MRTHIFVRLMAVLAVVTLVNVGLMDGAQADMNDPPNPPPGCSCSASAFIPCSASCATPGGCLAGTCNCYCTFPPGGAYCFCQCKIDPLTYWSQGDRCTQQVQN